MLRSHTGAGRPYTSMQHLVTPSRRVHRNSRVGAQHLSLWTTSTTSRVGRGTHVRPLGYLPRRRTKLLLRVRRTERGPHTHNRRPERSRSPTARCGRSRREHVRPTTSGAPEVWMRTLHPTLRQSAMSSPGPRPTTSSRRTSKRRTRNPGWTKWFQRRGYRRYGLSPTPAFHEIATLLTTSELIAEAADCRTHRSPHRAPLPRFGLPQEAIAPPTEAVCATAGCICTYTIEDALADTSARLRRWRAGMYGTSRCLGESAGLTRGVALCYISALAERGRVACAPWSGTQFQAGAVLTCSQCTPGRDG